MTPGLDEFLRANSRTFGEAAFMTLVDKYGIATARSYGSKEASEAFADVRLALRKLLTVPEGFVLAPKEPTPEMLTVDFEQCCVAHFGAGGKFCSLNRRSLYKAMLAAAPKQRAAT